MGMSLYLQIFGQKNKVFFALMMANTGKLMSWSSQGNQQDQVFVKIPTYHVCSCLTKACDFNTGNCWFLSSFLPTVSICIF